MEFFTEVIYVPRNVMIVSSLLTFGIGAMLGMLTFRVLHDSEE